MWAEDGSGCRFFPPVLVTIAVTGCWEEEEEEEWSLWLLPPPIRCLDEPGVLVVTTVRGGELRTAPPVAMLWVLENR